MMSDEFIESVISTNRESKDETMISRTFNGMESVAQFEEDVDYEFGPDDN